MFDIVSQKFEKHGYLEKISLYRIQSSEQVKELGNFFFSPQYLFVEKDPISNMITKIETLSGPGDVRDCQTFLRHLNEIAGEYLGKNFMKDIKINSRL